MAEKPAIPVQVRTARKQHRCDEYLCRVPIEPGDKYELHVVPPHREESRDVDRWLVHKSHWPRNPESGQFLLGCTLAAAYQEKARRERPCRFCGGYEGGASSGPGAGCICEDIEYLATLPPVLEDDDD